MNYKDFSVSIFSKGYN